MAENEEKAAASSAAVRKKTSKKKASKKKATRKKTVTKKVTPKAAEMNQPATVKVEPPLETDPATVATVKEVIETPVQQEAVAESDSRKGGGFAEFMLKALMFWVVVAAIGVYLYTVYSPGKAPFVPEPAEAKVEVEDSVEQPAATEITKKVEAELPLPVQEEKPRFAPTMVQAPRVPASNYRPLPPDQVQMIIRTFAPEQLSAEEKR